MTTCGRTAPVLDLVIPNCLRCTAVEGTFADVKVL